MRVNFAILRNHLHAALRTCSQAGEEGQERGQRRLGRDSDAPNNVLDADLKALVEWILAAK